MTSYSDSLFEALKPSRIGIVLQRGRLVSTAMGCSWKYGRSFLDATRRAKVAYSRWLYLVSASAKDLLTKNTSLCLPSSFSLNRAALTTTSEIDKYTKSVSSAPGLEMTGGSTRYCLIAIKA